MFELNSNGDTVFVPFAYTFAHTCSDGVGIVWGPCGLIRRMNITLGVSRGLASLSLASMYATACKDQQLDTDELPGRGEACQPGSPEDQGDDAPCVKGFTCERVGDADDQFVCATPLEIQGMVIDALTEQPIEGALVAALDDTRAPVTDVAVSDAQGNYTLYVPAKRTDDGELTPDATWFLQASAKDYQAFPYGVRPEIPISAADATTGEDNDDPTLLENASTTIALIPLTQAQGVTISGQVVGTDVTGVLVIAEDVSGEDVAPSTIADLSGHFTLFNVPAGDATLRGYRFGLDIEPKTVTIAAQDLTGVDLNVVTANVDDMATVTGSVNIVNAPGGSMTSVVLIPVTAYNPVFERGPVPFGLRAPKHPAAPDIANAFAIDGVPAGTYKVLAAFENDDLVRDPDLSIAGTDLQEITVMSGQDTIVDASFKITEALAVIGPGAETPEAITAAPSFQWGDDSSEDYYSLQVYDAIGTLVLDEPMVPRVTGNPAVTFPFDGELMAGMYYQFRATSWKDGQPISRTEDQRGVFVYSP